MGTRKQSADILLVEAGMTSAQQTLEALRGAGHAMRWARSVRDARAELQIRVPDLLLLDLSLETDGLELLQALRFSASDPQGGIVVLVDARDAHRRERAHQLGAAAVLARPVSLETLTMTVKELIDWL